MANYSALIRVINNQIKANGNQEITGPVLNAVLQAIVSGMSEGALFAGIATTTTNPPAYDGNVFYIAIEPGTYSNFGVDVPGGSIGVLHNMDGNKWDVFPINTYYTIDVDTLMQDSPSSDDINEAIGGLSNLKRAIIAGVPFFGRSASGNSTVAIAQVEQLSANEVRAVMLNTGTVDGSNELVPIIKKITVSAGQLSLSTEAPTSFIGPLSSLSTNEKGSVVGAINEVAQTLLQVAGQMKNKQDKTDESLQTSDKTVAGAINEVNQKKVNAAPGKNLFNPDDPEVLIGYYVAHIGVIKESASYNASGYIKVEPGQTYFCAKNSGQFRFVCFFNSDKDFVSGGTENTRSFIVPQDVHYVRVTFFIEDYTLAQVSKEEIDYIPYSPISGYSYDIHDDSIGEKNIKDKAVTTSKISEKAVRIEQLSFSESINLLDAEDKDVAIGKYIASNKGNLSNNETYNTSGFIKVKPDTTYVLRSIESTNALARFVLFYDADRNPIEDTLQSYIKRVVTSSETHYIRISLYANNWGTAQVTEGETEKPYRPYQLQIPAKCIYGIDNIVKDEIQKGIVFFLPKDIYVAKGRTIEIYYEQICLNYQKYNIKAECQIGKALERKYQIIGGEQQVGKDFILTISVLDDSLNVLAKGESNIHIVDNTIAASKKVLPVGDSLTNDKYWLTEVPTLASNNISFVGTRNNIHEGRSGGTVSFYLDETGIQKYTFDSLYTGIGSDAEEFSDAKEYNIGDYVKKAYDYAGTGEFAYYIFTKNHAIGAWNEDEVFCVSMANPFYDYIGKKWSISAYKSRNGISYDAIIIFLGTNGINEIPETNINGALGIKNLIDKIRLEDSNTPILVINTIFRSGQNGIGNQGNVDGYSAQSEYKFNADRKVLLLAKALQNMIGEYPNTYLCPCGFTMDSRYDFGNVKVPVNPRLTDTTEVYEINPTDSVHPLKVGYEQIADEMFSALSYVFNK